LVARHSTWQRPKLQINPELQSVFSVQPLTVPA
jgi:hypothetical protein